MKTVTVSADALRQVLQALIGPPHYIRELQVLRGSIVDPDNAIDVLIKEFNEAVEAWGKPDEEAKNGT